MKVLRAFIRCMLLSSGLTLLVDGPKLSHDHAISFFLHVGSVGMISWAVFVGDDHE